MLSNQVNEKTSSMIEKLKYKILNVDKLILFIVIVPTLLSILYYGVIASDVYVSESRFVVRSPQKVSEGGLGALLQGSGFTRSQDDAYSVRDYLLSRDALQNLNQKMHVETLYNQNKIDIFNRFSGLSFDDSFEALYRYYLKHVSLDLELSSSISTLKVDAYRAEDAYQINEKLIEMGETLINQLNERGRKDLIKFSTNEVSLAEDKAKAAALALSTYRNKNKVFDPERQSTLQLQQISKLQDELIATKTQLAQVQTFTPENPQIPALKKRVETLQEEMSAEMSKVAGGDGSLTNKAAEYERLTLERAFADRQLTVALASLEQARNEALRKQLYLERIVQPNKPDYAVKPMRLRGILSCFLLSLLCLGIFKMLLAGMREHRE